MSTTLFKIRNNFRHDILDIETAESKISIEHTLLVLMDTSPRLLRHIKLLTTCFLFVNFSSEQNVYMERMGAKSSRFVLRVRE